MPTKAGLGKYSAEQDRQRLILIAQVELNPSLFTVNLPFGNAVRLKEPGSLEALKCSFLPAFGEAPPPTYPVGVH